MQPAPKQYSLAYLYGHHDRTDLIFFSVISKKFRSMTEKNVATNGMKIVGIAKMK